MVYLLSEDEYGFPDPLEVPEKDREEDGLFAVGGDLSSERILEAYAQGIFPWTPYKMLTDENGKEHLGDSLLWYCPMKRFVIFPDEIHVSHSMRTMMNKKEYEITMDEDFEGVIKNCSELRLEDEGAWLGPQMVKAFTKLHKEGYAHSVEVWKEGKLVGGLYGINLFFGFMGESMFSLVPSASKLALIWLCEHAYGNCISFIDCQFHTPHLEAMGGRFIDYREYLEEMYGSAFVDMEKDKSNK